MKVIDLLVDIAHNKHCYDKLKFYIKGEENE